MFFRNYNIQNENKNLFHEIIGALPFATAQIKGNQENSQITGTVKFFSTKLGVIVLNEINGLPTTQTNIFAEHIHENGTCDGDFESAGEHYNPSNQPHPNHAGDLPPLFSVNGYALSAVLTNRFNLDEIIGKTVIIHSQPDDFYTQPAGNSGQRIACGVIKRRLSASSKKY